MNPAFGPKFHRHDTEQCHDGHQHDTPLGDLARRSGGAPHKVSDVAGGGETSRRRTPAEDIEKYPENENGEEVKGTKVFDDKFEDFGNGYLRAMMRFLPALLDTHNPAE